MKNLIRDLGAKAKSVIDAGVLLVYPPRCLACERFVQSQGTLCGECWDDLSFIGDPCCQCCGHPFDSGELAGLLCGHCIQKTPGFTTARSALRYDEHSRRLVLGLKYADRTHGVPVYARWMARIGANALAEAQMILPVPLHRMRLIARRFNQSALLAQSLAKLSGIPYRPDILLRHRRTPPQEGLTRVQRQQNVVNAFSVPECARSDLHGKTVVLIDDVITTRATVDQCAKALRNAGAAKVHVLSLAYTARD